MPRVVPPELIRRMLDRFDGFWNGKFETGIYPDEWHWRKGMSLPDVTREICNIWKCDRLFAGVILSSGFGRLAASLLSWPGTRLAQDDIWHKPAGGKAIVFHQDSLYISAQFLPFANNSVTVWLALDDVRPETGTLQYVPGSHRWNNIAPHATKHIASATAGGGELPAVANADSGTLDFHVSSREYTADLYTAAAARGIPARDVRIVDVVAPAGSLAIHHQDLWHASRANTTTDTVRRSVGIHLMRSDVQFKPSGVGYIYGRYKRVGRTDVDEDFFPVVYSDSGYRTPWLADYCQDVLPS